MAKRAKRTGAGKVVRGWACPTNLLYVNPYEMDRPMKPFTVRVEIRVIPKPAKRRSKP